MKLENIIKDIEIKKIVGDVSVDISDIAYDSRAVRKGSCFIAVKGIHADGHQFIKDAVKNGAVAVVSLEPVNVNEGVVNVVTGDSRLALARLSSAFFDYPSKKVRTIGITGTNGKTTVSYLIESVLRQARRRVGVIGTVSWRYGDKMLSAPNTTPMAYDLQRLIYEMYNNGITDVVIEVSSHALDQGRVASVDFDSAVFTNLTHDHLDYHHGTGDYFNAKKRLFTHFLPEGIKKEKYAVINIDDGWGEKLVSECKYLEVSKLTYGFGNRADVRMERSNCTIAGNEMEVKTPWGKFFCSSHLKGRFNASNILAVVAVLGAFGIPLDIIGSGVEKVTSVPGRLECIPNDNGISIFVDYAHTPNALKNVISVLKDITSGRIITVFGCGGDRDKTKRPLMGEIAALLSDAVIVTSDNPRSEDPLKIIDEIVLGVKKGRLHLFGKNGKGYMVEEDRSLAIKRALEIAQKGDVVLIAGKGHETYQIVGNETRHFDDREEALKHLST